MRMVVSKIGREVREKGAARNDKDKSDATKLVHG